MYNRFISDRDSKNEALKKYYTVIVPLLLFFAVVGAVLNGTSSNTDTAVPAENEEYAQLPDGAFDCCPELIHANGSVLNGALVRTAFMIDSNDGEKNLKAHTSDQGKFSFMYGLVAEFDSPEDIADVHMGDTVVVTGTVSCIEMVSSVTLLNCKIEASGEEAKKIQKEIENGKDSQMELISKLPPAESTEDSSK